MSKPSEAQAYMLAWMASTQYGMISDLHAPPYHIPGYGDPPTHTSLTKQQLLGLVRRGMAEDRGNSLFRITDAGRAWLTKHIASRKPAATPSTRVVCPRCSGGGIDPEQPGYECSACHGDGWIYNPV